MLRSLAVSIVFAMSPLLVASAVSAGPEAPGPEVVIRVTSVVADTEFVVKGGYVSAACGQEFQPVKQRTPFEIRQPTGVLVGLFSAAADEARIQVEMVSRAEGGKVTRVTGTGRAVSVVADENQGGASIRSMSGFNR